MIVEGWHEPRNIAWTVVLLSGSSEPEARRVLVPPERSKCLGFYFAAYDRPGGPASAKNERSFSVVSRRRDERVLTKAQRTA